MSEVTLEKEILEEEKKGSIFETQAFKFTFEGLINAGKETGDKEELSNLLKTHLVKFVQERHPGQVIPEDIVETTFFAASAVTLAGEILRQQESVAEEITSKAIKRVIRKENMIGFNTTFDDDTEGGIIMPKEQYNRAVEEGLDIIEIVNRNNTCGKTIVSAVEMTEEELDNILELSADTLLKDGFDE